jgi:hypothetical protein
MFLLSSKEVDGNTFLVTCQLPYPTFPIAALVVCSHLVDGVVRCTLCGNPTRSKEVAVTFELSVASLFPGGEGQIELPGAVFKGCFF